MGKGPLTRESLSAPFLLKPPTTLHARQLSAPVALTREDTVHVSLHLMGLTKCCLRANYLLLIRRAFYVNRTP